MCRIQKLQNQTTACAIQSSCHIMVGAMIVKGNKVYATGHNNRRTEFLGMRDLSQHAELAAATTFINTVVKRNPKKYCFVWEKGKEQKK